jgi:hypothetical protein
MAREVAPKEALTSQTAPDSQAVDRTFIEREMQRAGSMREAMRIIFHYADVRAVLEERSSCVCPDSGAD